MTKRDVRVTVQGVQCNITSMAEVRQGRYRGRGRYMARNYLDPIKVSLHVPTLPCRRFELGSSFG